jgi:hypothetical protein
MVDYYDWPTSIWDQLIGKSFEELDLPGKIASIIPAQHNPKRTDAVQSPHGGYAYDILADLRERDRRPILQSCPTGILRHIAFAEIGMGSRRGKENDHRNERVPAFA